MKHVALCIFNRASYGRSKTLIQALSDDDSIKLTAIAEGRPDFSAPDYIEDPHHKRFLYLRNYGGCASERSARIAGGLRSALNVAQPDAVVAVADRFETMPVALVAGAMNIPVIHLQAGENTGNLDQKVRWAVSAYADYAVAHTLASYERIQKFFFGIMGAERDPSRVLLANCPSTDLIHDHSIVRSEIKTSCDDEVICIFHPDTETAGESFSQTREVHRAIKLFCEEKHLKCTWFYPNPDPGREGVAKYLDEVMANDPEVFSAYVNEPTEAFLRRLARCQMIVGNSSAGIRESSYLGVPSVNVGQRQRHRECSSNVVHTQPQAQAILDAMRSQYGRTYRPSSLFCTEDVSGAQKIARWIAEMNPTLRGA